MSAQLRLAVLAIASLAWAPPAWAAVAVAVSPPSPLSGTVTITATVTGFWKLGEVRISVDGAKVATCRTSPCVVRWNAVTVADGPHTIQAKTFTPRALLTGVRSVKVEVVDTGPIVTP